MAALQVVQVAYQTAIKAVKEGDADEVERTKYQLVQKKMKAKHELEQAKQAIYAANNVLER